MACSIWVKTIQELCANFDYSDSPWEYLERTNSAVFASGVPSMPETYVMRNGRKEQKDQRVDVCSVDTGKLIELIEFKMAEYDAIYPQTIQRIASRIKQATAQANTITGIHGIEITNSDWSIKRSVGVIGLPCFEPGTQKTDMEDTVQNLIKDLRNSTYDVKEWVFPPEYIANPSRHYRKKFYPGTYLVAKRA